MSDPGSSNADDLTDEEMLELVRRVIEDRELARPLFSVDSLDADGDHDS
jgi:hypothetical protein